MQRKTGGLDHVTKRARYFRPFGGCPFWLYSLWRTVGVEIAQAAGQRGGDRQRRWLERTQWQRGHKSCLAILLVGPSYRNWFEIWFELMCLNLWLLMGFPAPLHLHLSHQMWRALALFPSSQRKEERKQVSTWTKSKIAGWITGLELLNQISVCHQDEVDTFVGYAKLCFSEMKSSSE